jgi:hypothetical protein
VEIGHLWAFLVIRLMPGYEDNMQNIKIEDDFLQARNLTKALILIADSQGEQDGYLCDALYGIAYSMEAPDRRYRRQASQEEEQEQGVMNITSLPGDGPFMWM